LQCRIPTGTTSRPQPQQQQQEEQEQQQQQQQQQQEHALHAYINFFHGTFTNFASVLSSHNNKMSASKIQNGRVCGIENFL